MVNIEDILKDGMITLITPVQGGLTKEVHLAEYRGERYILRRCNGNADRLVRVSEGMRGTGVVPKLLERRKGDLLYEFIEGRDLTYDDVDLAYEVGRIAGLATKIPPSDCPDVDGKFFKSLRYLVEQEIVDPETGKRILEEYARLKPDQMESSKEVGDLIPGNFRISDSGVFLVDIDSVYTDLKGNCFAKAFLKWFKPLECRREFLRGYEEFADSGFLTRDYLQFVYLNFLVRKTCAWHKRGTNYRRHLDRLNFLLKGDLE